MNLMPADPRQSGETEFQFSEQPGLSEELRMLREQVRRFVEREVIPHGEEWERAGKIPREVFRKMGALGFLGMRHEAEYGGTDMGPVASMVFAEELGRSSFGGFTSSTLVHSDMSAVHITLRGTPEQKRKYLPAIIRGETICSIAVTEPDAGSDVAGLKTRARREGDSWVINGAKMFITNAVYGDILIVAARTDSQAKGSRGISLFIVERNTPGISASKLDKHGWLCSDTAELGFQDVRVPAENLLGEENKGFYGIMETFQNERICIGGICAGESAKAIELTTEYVKTRQAFGGPLWNQQAVRLKLAQLAAKAAAARQLAYHAAELAAAGQPCLREVSMVKALSPEVLHEVVHGCLQLHGGTGFMRGTAIERMVRDARVLTIGGGATEVMLEEVAKRM
ncbi:acyl-CoA dehydrogenase family protein [Bradyrhizobium tropiciagri]|uniref:acyl-CoA dehydrogenase family protein n=1 Tax=Bradyrhizobium tropiciagri TaxID=312253 RepID=UPI001BA6A581|nr:acyl-CoA dehydrogenase family protein [Bradyrhizobium tropiciagri]MBR0875000.1 acyl-CoA dehydrogenase family protein [Bradyrhizobium tropiciagri]